MPIGSEDFVEVYLGGIQIERIYIGSQQVWPDAGQVPGAFAPSQWSLANVSSAPGQFSPSMWRLEDA